MAALQVVALMNDQGVRQSEILSLRPDVIRRDWPKAVEALDVALRFLILECGVLTPGWLPYGGLLLTLAGAVQKHGDPTAHRELIRRWFFARTFAQDYEVAANTVTVSELKVLSTALATSTPPTVRRMSLDHVVAATRRRQSSLWRGFLCALAANGAKDLDVNAEADDLQPVNILQRESDPPRGEDAAHLLTMGLVLASRRVGRTLANVGAAQLRVHLTNDRPAHQKAALKTQLLPPLDAWGDTDRDFVRARALRLSDFLQATTGAPLVPDPPEVD
jgi:hypothetical protein